MIEATRGHLGWALHESGPETADHTVLLLPGALCTAAFYDDLLAEPSMSTARIRFIATTMPGFGGTAPPKDVSMESYSKLAGKVASTCASSGSPTPDTSLSTSSPERSPSSFSRQ